MPDLERRRGGDDGRCSEQHEPDKKKATGRIDGVVALIMAMGASGAKTERAPEYQLLFV
jgi:phage terminase large subunit-like protein